MLQLLIYLMVLVAVGGVVFWFINQVSIPEPFKWVVYLFVAIIAIVLLLQVPALVGHPGTLRL